MVASYATSYTLLLASTNAGTMSSSGAPCSTTSLLAAAFIPLGPVPTPLSFCGAVPFQQVSFPSREAARAALLTLAPPSNFMGYDFGQPCWEINLGLGPTECFHVGDLVHVQKAGVFAGGEAVCAHAGRLGGYHGWRVRRELLYRRSVGSRVAVSSLLITWAVAPGQRGSLGNRPQLQ
jgi:hypothetical protein